MMTIVLSVRPPWARLLVAGKKTVELRKTPLPGDDGLVRALIYETKAKGGCGALIGEVIFWRPAAELGIPPRELRRVDPGEYSTEAITRACLSWGQAKAYAAGKYLHAWEVSDRPAREYLEPRPLKGRPPQSWRWAREGES